MLSLVGLTRVRSSHRLTVSLTVVASFLRHFAPSALRATSLQRISTAAMAEKLPIADAGSTLSPLDTVAYSLAATLPADRRPRQAPDVISVAPMMEWTDRHYRFLVRLLTKRTRLYTEMVVDKTLVHSHVARSYIQFNPEEHPVVCQLGGSDPESLAYAAKMVQDEGYDEINLNCGCPSEKVAGKGCFGAALMFTPELVRDCVVAMRRVVTIPISVKCRLGADGMDSYPEFANFIAVVSQGGCEHFVVHARKCLLNGLNPKQNRTIPPLRYHWVQRAALEFPHLRISLNGGVANLDQTISLLQLVRGVPAGGSLPPTPPPVVVDVEGGVGSSSAAVKTQVAALHASTPVACSRAFDVALGGPAAPVSMCCPTGRVDASVSVAVASASEASRDAAALTPQTVSITATIIGAVMGECSSGDQSTCVVSLYPSAGTGEVCAASTETGEPAAAAAATPPVVDVALGTDGYPSDPMLQLTPGVFRDTTVSPCGFGMTPTAVLDSVMIGRAAYHNPWLLADADRRLFGVPNPGLSRREVIEQYLTYADNILERTPLEWHHGTGMRPFEIVRPLVTLFSGKHGGARFRDTLTRGVLQSKLPLREAVAQAVACVLEADLDERPPP